MSEPGEYDRYRQDVEVLAEIGAVLALAVPTVRVTIPRHLASAAAAAWDRDEEGPAGAETCEQARSRRQAGDLALLGLAISKGSQLVGEGVVVELPAAQFAAAVTAWVESQ
ncbi:hypothetical protein GCM10023322_70410 [Rugosimonospora acidiphila]|uniref:Uncharacterized protein n=1 Tax=Rugosimonospora acidiphila TaxID=556531 RepID=A0ABP9SMA2_9ACTN